jgi:altronate hydrolase
VNWLRLNVSDNVAVALEPLSAGFHVKLHEQYFLLATDIRPGHKFAISELPAGSSIIKYGNSIGTATKHIRAGEHVHVHNLTTALRELESYAYCPTGLEEPEAQPSSLTFDGYRRENGLVGTRNEIWVLCTVGCVAHLAQTIARRANEVHKGRCDGVYAFTHPFGCSQAGDDLKQTQRVLAALARNPNAGGVLLVGLGCEDNQGGALLEEIPQNCRDKVRFFNCQAVADELEEGLKQVAALVDHAAEYKRVPCPASELVLGMKCGGSDGFSGLTANPLVGRIANRMTALNGAVLLTETPEMFGAEQLLMNRATSREVFLGIVDLVGSFKQYLLDHGQAIYDNPSPGNRIGGITTLEEKSLGAIQKGGIATVTDVLKYGEVVRRKGLSLLEAPGNDAVSSTALIASGATMILFTTGRGTPLGFPVPSVKISSNSQLAALKKNWIDFDAGRVLVNGDFDSITDELMQLIIEVASGRKQTRSECNDQREIAIWKKGATL